MKPVNWHLEYVKESCFIRPKASMNSSRYNHMIIYDEKRLRIYVIGGIGSDLVQ
jgi:hypothetical protein